MKLRETEKKEWWDDISAAEKNSIEKGVQDADKGESLPHSSAKKIYGKWL